MALAIIGGVYLELLVSSPVILSKFNHNWNIVPSHTSAVDGNRLYVPKLKLNLPYNTGSAAVLNIGAWHRFPDRGDPQKGGNFILAGHRFKIGSTPAATKDSSPFYHLNILGPGDKIYVDFSGKRYEYAVTKNYTVAPTETEIEAPSATPKMTLYTCTLKGSSDGREVVDATLIASNVNPAKQF